MLVAQEVDRAHRQPGVHAEEGVDASVAAGELHRDEAVLQGREAGAVVPRDHAADDAEPCHRGDELLGEAGGLPRVVDDRQHLVLDEAAHALDEGAIGVGEALLETVGIR
ncbi:hypothetical protein GCM10025869_14930 [Homoserinibacter gongjuensis]|uniref:Uncharacterized protein n=1 Tax=Homoserinibacter gongjuensis TaxID=1162968 RepID=A0ABQ6JV31_9MICO|nr:hypothetical protein GCM10025869_14930 [Homoserinibacter gongjuensis]